MVFYILLKAVDRFYTQYHRYPGINESQIDGDIFSAVAQLFPSKCKRYCRDIGETSVQHDTVVLWY